MSIRLSQQDATATIEVSGRFDYSVHQEFCEGFEKLAPTVDHWVIDLSETLYMDSSALGMLLLLRERAGGDDASIDLVGCNEQTGRVLAVGQFDQLFRITRCGS